MSSKAALWRGGPLSLYKSMLISNYSPAAKINRLGTKQHDLISSSSVIPTLKDNVRQMEAAIMLQRLYEQLLGFPPASSNNRSADDLDNSSSKFQLYKPVAGDSSVSKLLKKFQQHQHPLHPGHHQQPHPSHLQTSPDFAWIAKERESSWFPSFSQKKASSDDNHKQSSSWLSSLFNYSSHSNRKHHPPMGVYLHGGVGTGKSLLLDLLYTSLQTTPFSSYTRRLHYLQFMEEVHSTLHHIRTYGCLPDTPSPTENIVHRDRKNHGEAYKGDPVPLLASHIAQSTTLLCLDELQVTNIVDAMLLRRLFSLLLVEEGGVLVATSNRHPDELYKNGIQRQAFLQTIELLKEKCFVFNLDTPLSPSDVSSSTTLPGEISGEVLDYRKVERLHNPVYWNNLNREAQAGVKNIFTVLGQGVPVQERTLMMWGRPLHLPFCLTVPLPNQAERRVCKTTFKHLCSKETSASSSDYLQLAKSFDILILEGVPRMSRDTKDEARRFITLLDALYDAKVKLVATFETDLYHLFDGDDDIVDGVIIEKKRSNSTGGNLLADDLKMAGIEVKPSMFTGDEEQFAFQRAVSRLIEMQGAPWWPEFDQIFLHEQATDQVLSV